MNFQEVLEFYKENNNSYEIALKLESFYSIDCQINNPSEEEYRVISDVAIYLYMKDEGGIGITKITDFLALQYAKKNITLEEIKNSSKWDLLDAIYYNDIKFIKK